jgi:hypothetical protein
MGRKVSVKLEADVAGFVAPMGTAKKATDDLGDKVSKLDRELDKIPADAAKAAAAMKLLGGEAVSAGGKLDDIGKGTKLTLLDAKLRETRGEVRKLADEFQKTGDVDVFKRLGDAQGRLAALTKVRKSVADSFEFGVEDGLKSASRSPSLMAVGGTIGAGLAIPLAAALGGALAGATGFGIAGVGIAGAILGDPQRFQLAWSRTLNDLQAEFVNATRPLTDDTIHAISTIGPMVRSWHLSDLFDQAQKYVEPLVQGVEGFATGIVHGVEALVEHGEPAVNALATSMSRLGVATGTAMAEIANGADGGAAALNDLAKVTSYVIVGLGGIVEGAEKAYSFIQDHPFAAAIASFGMTIPISLLGEADDTTKHLQQTELGLRKEAEALGHVFDQQGEDLTLLQAKMNATTVSTDTLAASMTNKIFTALMGIDQATLGVAESQLRLRETFEENAKTLKKHADQLDINTKQGQSNRESVLASVTANMQLYQAQVAAGMSADDAAVSYNENTAALEKQLHKANLTQQEIDGLIGKYREVPNTVNTTIAIEGLTDAINNLNRTILLIAGIKSKDVYVRVFNTVYDVTTGVRKTGSSQLAREQEQFGGIRHAAEGMIVPPSNPGTVLFGEPATGGELYLPLRGITPSRAMGLAQVAGNNYGFSVTPAGAAGGGNISITLVGGDPATQALMTGMRAVIRKDFNGSVQVALGQGAG